jgi:hypothetical protein
MITSGTIKWKGTRGGNNNTSKTVVHAPELTEAKMVKLAEDLQPFSDAIAQSVSITATKVSDAALPLIDANMDEYCVIVMQEIETGTIHRYNLPAFAQSLVIQTANGDRLDAAIGQAITLLFQVLLGIGLRFIQGWIEKRR